LRPVDEATTIISLADTCFLFLKAEGQMGADGLSWNTESIFDLSNKTIGTNGCATLRRFIAQHTGIDPGTNDCRNSSVSAGFESNGVSSVCFVGTRSRTGRCDSVGMERLLRLPTRRNVASD
jgi:hypothetical protein